MSTEWNADLVPEGEPQPIPVERRPEPLPHIHDGSDPNCEPCGGIAAARAGGAPDTGLTPAERQRRDEGVPLAARAISAEPSSVLRFRSTSGRVEITTRGDGTVRVSVLTGSDVLSGEDIARAAWALKVASASTGMNAARAEPGKRPIAQWVVEDPYGEQHVYEEPWQAMMFAFDTARAERATVVRTPAESSDHDVVVMRLDPRVTLQVVRQLTGPSARPPEPSEASVQALAGARLFYALYHDGEAVMWLMTHREDTGKKVGFRKAYMSAQAAFLPPELRRSAVVEDDNPNWLVREGPAPGDPIHPDDVRRLIAQGRREGAQLPEGWYQRDGVQEPLADLELRCIQKGREEAAEAIMDRAALIERLPAEVRDNLIAQGRVEAAEAIRSQARMYDADPGAMFEVKDTLETAARLAEGTTGVQADER